MNVYKELEKELCEKYGYTTKHPYNDGYTEFYNREGKMVDFFNTDGFSLLKNVINLCEVFTNER